MIAVEDGNPTYCVQEFENKVEKNGLIIRNLFTLTGTVSDNVLDTGSKLYTIPGHFGYASVGIINDVGEGYLQFEPGMLVVLSPKYSKYIKVNNVRELNKDESYFNVIPKDLDKVDATFIPLVSLALTLYQNIENINDKKRIILLGCNIVGIILLKLLVTYGEVATVILDNDVIKPDLLIESGAESVFNYGDSIPQDLINNAGNIFVLSNSPWASNIQNSFLEVNPYCNFVQFQNNYSINNTCSWRHHDTINLAIELLKEERLNVKDLIGQHVHAESALDTFHSIKKNVFGGKVVVYDW